MIVGIDPDLVKSGVAIVKDGKLVDLMLLDFFELITLFAEHEDEIKKVVVEAGWLIAKSNWHGVGKNKAVCERIAKSVGENHATGKLIAHMAERMGLKVQLLKPHGKKNAEQFKRMTGWQGRTNQETRDAGLLIHGMQ